MDKRRERQILDYVFGSREAVTVTEHERPDFVCDVGGALSFGVEVAEFFLSQSAARLTRIDGYADELLKTRQYRHKDDKVKIPVSDVIYRVAKTGQEIPLTAIMSEEYSATKVVGRFCDLVCTKNAKHEQYKNGSTAVDLIIYDADSILAPYTIEDWMRAIHRLNIEECITASPFREIYAVTAREANRKFCVPLRAALFVSEILAFQSIFKDFHSESLGNMTRGQYLKSLAVHLVSKFQGIECRIDDRGNVSFIFASVAISYGKERAGLDVRDISLESTDGREKLSEGLDATLNDEFSKYVCSKRGGIFVCVPIQFDAYEPERTEERSAL